MDVNTLFETFGSSAIFIAACFYLLKRIETRDAIRDAEARERELELAKRLNESDTYVRDVLMGEISKSSTAMLQMTYAVQNIPCIQTQPNGTSNSNSGFDV